MPGASRRRTMTRIAIALIIAAGSYTACVEPACAEERIIEVGETITSVDGRQMRVGETMFCFDRQRLDAINATKELETRLRAQLETQAKAIATMAPRREPEWKIAARWAAITLAVGGAFLLGTQI